MAVNSYRFIAMYLLIGLLVGTITAFNVSTTDTQTGYDLAENTRIEELVNNTWAIYDDSETLVQANQFVLSSSYGDERALGGSWRHIFSSAFLPTGLIPEEQLNNATELEQGINKIVIWFRWIILLFAGYELFQMILRKTT